MSQNPIWGKAIEHVNSKVENLSYLYSRWQAEKQYEDFLDYENAIKKMFSDWNILYVKKNPFSFAIAINQNVSMLVTITSKKGFMEIGWKCIKKKNHGM